MATNFLCIFNKIQKTTDQLIKKKTIVRVAKTNKSDHADLVNVVNTNYF